MIYLIYKILHHIANVKKRNCEIKPRAIMPTVEKEHYSSLFISRIVARLGCTQSRQWAQDPMTNLNGLMKMKMMYNNSL